MTVRTHDAAPTDPAPGPEGWSQELAAAVRWSERVGRTTGLRTGHERLLAELLTVGVTGLTGLYRPESEEFAAACRARRTRHGHWRITLLGQCHRTTAIVAMGAAALPDSAQRVALGGRSADQLAGRLVERCDQLTDIGDAALTCWAAAELGRADTARALGRLTELDTGQQLPTSYCAWVVSALATIARHQPDLLLDSELVWAARDRLLSARYGALFGTSSQPPAGPRPGRRATLPDQAFAIAALARLHTVLGDRRSRARAAECAASLVRLQGGYGQWGYSYDAGCDELVEPYPVRSVHQHALVPMALLELAEAGGPDHLPALRRGLDWLLNHPETAERPWEPGPGLLWAEVGRGGLAGALRPVQHALARFHPGLRPLGLSLLAPPNRLARVGRPADVGWLAYAWLASGR